MAKREQRRQSKKHLKKTINKMPQLNDFNVLMSNGPIDMFDSLSSIKKSFPVIINDPKLEEFWSMKSKELTQLQKEHRNYLQTKIRIGANLLTVKENFAKINEKVSIVVNSTTFVEYHPALIQAQLNDLQSALDWIDKDQVVLQGFNNFADKFDVSQAIRHLFVNPDLPSKIEKAMEESKKKSDDLQDSLDKIKKLRHELRENADKNGAARQQKKLSEAFIDWLKRRIKNIDEQRMQNEQKIAKYKDIEKFDSQEFMREQKKKYEKLDEQENKEILQVRKACKSPMKEIVKIANGGKIIGNFCSKKAPFLIQCSEINGLICAFRTRTKYHYSEEFADKFRYQKEIMIQPQEETKQITAIFQDRKDKHVENIRRLLDGKEVTVKKIKQLLKTEMNILGEEKDKLSKKISELEAKIPEAENKIRETENVKNIKMISLEKEKKNLSEKEEEHKILYVDSVEVIKTLLKERQCSSVEELSRSIIALLQIEHLRIQIHIQRNQETNILSQAIIKARSIIKQLRSQSDHLVEILPNEDLIVKFVQNYKQFGVKINDSNPNNIMSCINLRNIIRYYLDENDFNELLEKDEGKKMNCFIKCLKDQFGDFLTDDVMDSKHAWRKFKTIFYKKNPKEKKLRRDKTRLKNVIQNIQRAFETYDDQVLVVEDDENPGKTKKAPWKRYYKKSYDMLEEMLETKNDELEIVEEDLRDLQEEIEEDLWPYESVFQSFRRDIMSYKRRQKKWCSSGHLELS